MSKIGTVTLTDITGKKHEFNSYSLDTDWRNVGTVYGFMKVYSDKSFKILYLGKAKSMCNRHNDHEKWDEAKELGMNRIIALVVETESERQRLEEALIQAYNPPLNTHHVQKKPEGKSGFYR